jgi:hypothetical protein
MMTFNGEDRSAQGAPEHFKVTPEPVLIIVPEHTYLVVIGDRNLGGTELQVAIGSWTR